jgi:hypothetical protein
VIALVPWIVLAALVAAIILATRATVPVMTIALVIQPIHRATLVILMRVQVRRALAMISAFVIRPIHRVIKIPVILPPPTITSASVIRPIQHAREEEEREGAILTTIDVAASGIHVLVVMSSRNRDDCYCFKQNLSTEQKLYIYTQDSVLKEIE